MRILILAVIAAAHLAAAAQPTWAHGDEPHPKCKKGYVLSDDHRCVQAPA